MSNDKEQSGAEIQVLSPEAGAVLNKQQEIANLENEMDKVFAVWQEQGQHESRLKADLPDMAAMSREFDELLAAHLTGDATDEVVALYQKRVDLAQKTLAEITPQIDSTRRMREVLYQRHEGMVARAVELKKEKAALVLDLLHAEARAECERYVEAARTVSAAYRRLRSLDLILRSHGVTHSLHAHAPELFIPRFLLPACDAEGQSGHRTGALFDSSFELRPEARMELVRETKQRLHDEIGVEFDA
jgi:hypothetical protein